MCFPSFRNKVRKENLNLSLGELDQSEPRPKACFCVCLSLKSSMCWFSWSSVLTLNSCVQKKEESLGKRRRSRNTSAPNSWGKTVNGFHRVWLLKAPLIHAAVHIYTTVSGENSVLLWWLMENVAKRGVLPNLIYNVKLPHRTKGREPLWVVQYFILTVNYLLISETI